MFFKLGTQVGTTSYDVIQSEIQPSQSAQVYNTLNAALQALKNGQIDGIVVDFPTAYYMANVQLSNGTVVGILPSAGGTSEHFSLVLQKADLSVKGAVWAGSRDTNVLFVRGEREARHSSGCDH